MRARRLAAALLITILSLTGSGPAARAQGAPPHAWLFGSWTGGLFPVPAGLSAQACLAQPVVIFTRDIVLRATLTEQLYTQRIVETARTSGNTTEFRFSPGAAAAASDGLLGINAPPAPVDFGCGDPNLLRVQRMGENEISFPGCTEFTSPLVRCPGR